MEEQLHNTNLFKSMADARSDGKPSTTPGCVVLVSPFVTCSWLPRLGSPDIPRDWFLQPNECYFQTTPDMLSAQIADAGELNAVIEAGQRENEQLEGLAELVEMESLYQECMNAALRDGSETMQTDNGKQR